MAAGRLLRLRGIGPLLRILTFVGAALTAILLGAAVQVGRTPGLDWWFQSITLPFPLYSVVWCTVAILVLFFRGSYHPGIDVGFDLVGWGVNWGWSWLVFLEAAYVTADDFETKYTKEQYSYALKEAGVVKGLMFASGVFMVLYGALHLALFIMACKATHERRLRKKRGYTIELDDVAPLKSNAAPPQRSD